MKTFVDGREAVCIRPRLFRAIVAFPHILSAATALCASTLLLSAPLAADVPELPAIEGQPPDTLTPSQLMCFLAERNKEYQQFLEARRDGRTNTEEYRNLLARFGSYDNLAAAYQKYGKDYNIRWDYAFFQMLLETADLTYPGEVQREQNNFAGVGADGFWRRKSDGLRVRIIEKDGQWKGIAATGKWANRTLYRFIALGDNQFQVIRRTSEEDWVTDSTVSLIGRGELRPILREAGQEWYSGDTFSSLEQGVEAHIQHLSLYAGTMRADRSLIAAKSRNSRSLIEEMRTAWGRPIAWSDIGKPVEAVTVKDGKHPSIWAWENPEKPEAVGGYARALDRMAQTFARDYGPTPAVQAALAKYDEINAAYIANLKRQIAEQQALKAKFDEQQANAQKVHEFQQQALRDELAKALEAYSKRVAVLREQSENARNDDEAELRGTEAEQLQQSIADRTIVVWTGGEGRSYKDWETTLALREKAHADLMAAYARGEASMYSPYGSFTWKMTLARIKELETLLATATEGRTPHVLGIMSPAVTRDQLLEQLRQGGPKNEACRQLLGK